MYRILLLGAVGLVGAVAGVIGNRLVKRCFGAPALTLSFADLPPPGRGRKRRVQSLQHSNNGPDFAERDDH